jgi:predicted RNA-binding Zn-ribbon protein involved in translation (DUF1610 family)
LILPCNYYYTRRPPMENKMQPAEIAERLEIIRSEMFFNHAEDYIALDAAAEIVRKHDVVHSYWWDINGDGSEFVCAKCGIPAGWMNPHIKKQSQSVFCPNCGIKMDGERKDGEQ